MSEGQMWQELRVVQRALDTHLGECASNSRSVNEKLSSIRRIIWWAATGLIAGQAIVIAKNVLHWI